MSMFHCNECGAMSDADDGCGESEDGMALVCLECVCDECGEKPVFAEAFNERLCRSCADKWARNEEQIQ